MFRPSRPFAWLFCLTLLAAPAIHAQDDTTETRLREALRQTADKLHQAEADLAQQQLATAAAERERDALKQAPPAAKKNDAQSAALQHKLAAAEGDLAQAHADQQKTQSEQQASAQIAQQKETERAALASQLAKLRDRVKTCAANDDAFYGTGMEIAALYRDPDFIAHVRNRLPVPLGFDRVKLENRMRILEDRLSDLHAQAERCRTDGTPLPPPPFPAPPPESPSDEAPDQ